MDMGLLPDKTDMIIMFSLFAAIIHMSKYGIDWLALLIAVTAVAVLIGRKYRRPEAKEDSGPRR